jgi:hypothetical protein
VKEQPISLRKLRFATETRRRTRHVTSNPDMQAFVLELLDTLAARRMA